MNNAIQIIEASFEDAHTIGQIQAEAWLDSYPNPEKGVTKEDIQLKIDEWNQVGDKRIEDNLKNQNSHTWVAKKDQKVIGFVGVLKTEKENEIKALFVLPTYQGQGIGSKLLETCLNWLGKSKRITLEVVTYNAGAKSLYKRFGFREQGEALDNIIILPNGKIIPKVLMVKD